MLRNRKAHLIFPAAVLTLILLLGICLFPSMPGAAQKKKEPVRWQLTGDEFSPAEITDVPSGFAGLSFTFAAASSGTPQAETGRSEDSRENAARESAAQEAFFRLTEDSDSGIQFAYVPAEMTGPLQLRLHQGEQLVIEEGGDLTEALSEKALAVINTIRELNTSGSAAGTGTAAGSAEESKAATGTFLAGDTLPSFPEGSPFLFTILDADGQSLGTETVVFYYTQNVPSMYIETQSGSMEAVDADKHHETAEEAVYRVYLTDGTPDSSGTCMIKGRGNSTWSQSKRPYNLNFDQENILLDMSSCRKYALIANFWDSTQTRQYYAFLAAERLGLDYTPQTSFVNLYLNGKYQSLYLLTQRINVNGGTVEITNLDKKNRKANPEETDPQTEVMESDKKGHEALAYAWQHEPADLTGGYLLEFNNRYNKEDVWFSIGTLHISFKSPEQPSIGEYSYISDYVREAEAALFSGASDPDGDSADADADNFGSGKAESNGTDDPEAGSSVWDYFDMDSWARMYLIQDYFVQSDDEYYSFYFYKKAGDPLLYCRPVWDFDLSLGSMNCGDYYLTSARTLWLRDGRKKWLHQMDQYPEFRARVAELYLEELEPILRDLLENTYDRTVDLLEKDTNLNYLLWHKNLNYRDRTDRVRDLMQTRVQFLHDYYTDPAPFHQLLFHFAWDDFSYYVRDGESMGFLPTSEYGEKQTDVQVKNNGFITGWADDEGNLLEADTAIYEDLELFPVYKDR